MEKEKEPFYHLPDPGSGYWCPHCKQHIAGHPKVFRVNNLGILSGRCGTVTECRQCGEEIDFSGMMA